MFDGNYELDDMVCPQCGHSPTYSRCCQNIGCEDEWIDMREHDDSPWYNEGEEKMYRDCWRTDLERRCPVCGFNLQEYKSHGH